MLDLGRVPAHVGRLHFCFAVISQFPQGLDAPGSWDDWGLGEGDSVPVPAPVPERFS